MEQTFNPNILEINGDDDDDGLCDLIYAPLSFLSHQITNVWACRREILFIMAASDETTSITIQILSI